MVSSCADGATEIRENILIANKSLYINKKLLIILYRGQAEHQHEDELRIHKRRIIGSILGLVRTNKEYNGRTKEGLKQTIQENIVGKIYE